LWVDGNGNLYFLDRCRDDKRIFVVSADGQSIKTIEFDKTGGIADVDEDGNIYGLKLGGFILTRPDSTQQTSDNFNFFEVVDGVAYDRMHQHAVTIADHGNEPEKLTPHLFAPDIRYKYLNSFTIRTSKINAHLKKINRHLDVDSIQIKVDSRSDLGYADFIGVDDDGHAYCLYSYTLNNISGPFEEADVVVYSQFGQEIGRIQLPLRYFDKQIDVNDLALDIHGNLFQMLASEDGIRILKWIKN
jgi:sugar lactone lactonase YvrE